MPGRTSCYVCFKPAQLCVCGRAPRVENRTRILVLQHPRERFHPIGTARFATLGLSNVEHQVAWAARPATDAPFRLPPGTGLLYPAPDALDLAVLPDTQRPAALVVLDGTWHHARTMYRDQRWLHTLPRYRFTPAAPSRYRIRREPDARYVSTIEAIVTALRVLEPETTGFDELLAAFDSMIDDQLRFVVAKPGRRRVVERRRPARAVPRALVEARERLIVAYGESGGTRTRGAHHRDIVQWVAVRPHDGATFEALVRPRTPLDPHHVSMMGIEAARLDGGLSLDELRDQWARFARPGDVIAAWNQSTLDLLSTSGLVAGRTLLLKGAYCSLARRACGALEDVMAREGLRPVPTPFAGRARSRLGNALAVVQHLQGAAAHGRRPSPGVRTALGYADG